MWYVPDYQRRLQDHVGSAAHTQGMGSSLIMSRRWHRWVELMFKSVPALIFCDRRVVRTASATTSVAKENDVPASIAWSAIASILVNAQAFFFHQAGVEVGINVISIEEGICHTCGNALLWPTPSKIDSHTLLHPVAHKVGSRCSLTEKYEDVGCPLLWRSSPIFGFPFRFPFSVGSGKGHM